MVGLVWLTTTAGCGPAPAAIEGRVTLDGGPLDEAAVLFVPLDAERQKTGGAIKQGSYQIPASDGLLPGKYRVEIIDNPPLHGPPSGRRRRAFPYRYANESPLQVEVAEGAVGKGLRFDFQLTTAP